MGSGGGALSVLTGVRVGIFGRLSWGMGDVRGKLKELMGKLGW